MIYLLREIEGYSQGELARAVLRYGLYKEYRWDKEPVFYKNTYGKPYLADADEIYFNYSHSSQGIVCGISEKEIGVDIEKRLCYKENFAKKICHLNELQYLGQAVNQNEMITRIWTAKESYFKYMGTGIRSDLRLLDLSGCKNNYFQKEECFFTLFSEEEYGIAVCSLETNVTMLQIFINDIKRFL